MARAKPKIRAILAPLAAGSILLPNNAVAEVIAYTDPEPYKQAPGWLLGELEWNGWQVPVISFAMLSGSSDQDPVTAGSRILIVKTLSETASLYYVGILINGLPRLTALGPDSLEPSDDDTRSLAVFSRSLLGEQEALVPELGELTDLVEQAIYEQ